jgi:alkylation response protein AidB-like acyl-CoA dehydrogenase
MWLRLDDDQLALRDAVRSVLADSDVDAVWGRLAEMGLFAAAVPSSEGGLGLSEVDMVPLLEEVGYAAVPLPVAETAAVAAPLLPDAADGSKRVAVASGNLVPYGQVADLVLVLGSDIRLASATEPVSTVDTSRAAARLGPSGVLVTDDPVLVGSAKERAALATAAQLVGLSRRMLDMTVGYVRERHQFGVPVGSFQAVKHHLAEALLAVEFAAPAVLAAAWAMAERTETRERDVSAAVVLTVDAARSVARTAIQCHGAIGYTVEYDLHRYAKRVWALAATCDLDDHLDRLANSLELKGDADVR